MKIIEFFQSGRKFSMSRLVTFGALISGMYVMVRMALGDFTPNLSGSLMFTAFLAYGCGSHVFSKYIEARKDSDVNSGQ